MAQDQDIAVSDLTTKGYADITTSDYLMGVATAEAYKATISNIATRMAYGVFDDRYVQVSGDTMTGNLTISSATSYFYAKSTTYDTHISATAPSSAQYAGGYYVRDKDNNAAAYVRGAFLTTGIQRLELTCIRKDANDNSIYNGLYLGIDSSGNRTVTVTSGAEDAWLSALGLEPSSSWSSNKCAKWKKQGSVVTVCSTSTNTDVEIPVNTWTTIATIASGFRPSATVYSIAFFRNSAVGATIQVTSAGLVQAYSATAIASNSSVRFSVAYVI